MNIKKQVELKNIGMTYHTLKGETQAIGDISLDIFSGEIVTLVGPSGCGKSTLLSIIAGLIKPTSGSVYVSGKKVTEPSRNIGYMFQHDNLFEWRTILENVLLGLEVQNKLNEETKRFTENLLETYGLSEFKDHYPRQLSGGMRQRAALIRTLAIKPDILLLDEPFSALDYHTRLSMSDEICSILKKENKTAFMITHDIAEAISMGDRVVILTKRPAIVKEVVEIDLNRDDINCTPMKKRESPEFRNFFNRIWKELDIHD